MGNFNIAPMEENSLAKELHTLNLTVKAYIGLESGGKMNLCVITQSTLIQFYNLHGNLMI